MVLLNDSCDAYGRYDYDTRLTLDHCLDFRVMI